MTRKFTPVPSTKVLPKLLSSHEETASKIQSRIEIGNELLLKPINSGSDYEDFKIAVGKWDSYNEELLKRLASTDDLYKDYLDIDYPRLPDFPSASDEARRDVEILSRKIGRLEIVLNKLELIPVYEGIESKTSPNQQSFQSQQIFLVHGHDEGLRDAVALTLRQLGLEPVILSEKANLGMTIIEKLVKYGAVGFAVVLMTPDDIGATTLSEDALNPRARQNVILEMGYFLGRIGREKVCVLYKAGVEMPSDYQGVVWTKLDDEGSWRFKLCKELRAAGYSVDSNILLK